MDDKISYGILIVISHIPMPAVTVVMSVYNGEKYIAAAIDSMLAQTLTDFELLIVDDGSQDSTAQIARAYQERDSRVRFFQLARNMGLAAARNHAIAEATGEYITLMDGDDISLSERLERQVDFLRANPQIGVVGVSGRAVSADLAPLWDFDLPEQHSLIILDMFIGVGLIYSTVMLRRETLNAVGGYDAARRAGEERDLAWRLLVDADLKFANLPDHLLLYRRHDSSLSHNQSPSMRAQRGRSHHSHADISMGQSSAKCPGSLLSAALGQKTRLGRQKSSQD